MSLANQYGLYVIEGCAQVHGARFKDRYVGTFGHMDAYSMNWKKFFPVMRVARL